MRAAFQVLEGGPRASAKRKHPIDRRLDPVRGEKPVFSASEIRTRTDVNAVNARVAVGEAGKGSRVTGPNPVSTTPMNAIWPPAATEAIDSLQGPGTAHFDDVIRAPLFREPPDFPVPNRDGSCNSPSAKRRAPAPAPVSDRLMTSPPRAHRRRWPVAGRSSKHRPCRARARVRPGFQAAACKEGLPEP